MIQITKRTQDSLLNRCSKVISTVGYIRRFATNSHNLTPAEKKKLKDLAQKIATETIYIKRSIRSGKTKK